MSRLGRDLEKARAFERKRGSGLKRGKELDRGKGPERKKRIRQRNPERAAAALEKAFGPQAEECRHLPCVACRPELYGPEMFAWDHRSTVRISDPHHTVTRPAGKDRDCIPLCMGPAGHHRACSGINSSETRVQEACGLNFREVAARLHADMRGNKEAA